MATIEPDNVAILALPDELLERILDEVHFCPGLRLENSEKLATRYAFTHFLRDLRSIVRVCRRFHQLATPLLYRNLFFTVNLATPWAPLGTENRHPSGHAQRRLCKTLDKNPALRQHCETLSFIVIKDSNDIRPKGFKKEDKALKLAQLGLELSAAFPRTRLLMVRYGPSTPSGWTVFSHMVQNMPALRELQIRSEHGVRSIVENFGTTLNIRTLDLQSEWWFSNANDSTTWSIPERSLDITTLRLTNFSTDTPKDYYDGIMRLLMLIKRLEHFILKLRFDPEHPPQWNMGDILRSQCKTLRTLWIPATECIGVESFHLTEFPDLVDLSLSHWFTGHDTRLIKHLSGSSRLEKFTWVFDCPIRGRDDKWWGDQKVCYYHFTHEHAAWLRAFVSASAKVNPSLRLIHIDFRPNHKPNYQQLAKRPESVFRQWPWDLIDSDRADMKASGCRITLTYDKPTLSHEDFLFWMGEWEQVRLCE